MALANDDKQKVQALHYDDPYSITLLESDRKELSDFKVKLDASRTKSYHKVAFNFWTGTESRR